MTEFMKKKFTVPMQGDETYRDNWERIFGKKDEKLPDTLREPVGNSACPRCGKGAENFTGDCWPLIVCAECRAEMEDK